MNNLQFEICTDFNELGEAFGESPYFGREAVTYRDKESQQTNVLIARLQREIAGALTYHIPPYDGRLKIGLIEVREQYFGYHIGTQLLLEAEKRNQGKYQGCLAYLNDTKNTYSRNMFLRAGYHSFDTIKLYK